jgi:hypothetical protein
MTMHSLQIRERIDPGELPRMNQAHVDIADLGPPWGLVEQRILAMQDRQLESSLAKVMPTAGLCRAGGFRRARSKVRWVADTA